VCDSALNSPRADLALHGWPTSSCPEAPHLMRGAFSPHLTSIRMPQCDAACRSREVRPNGGGIRPAVRERPELATVAVL